MIKEESTIESIKEISNTLKEVDKKGSNTEITTVNGYAVIQNGNFKITSIDDIDYNKNFGENETEAILEKIEIKNTEQSKIKNNFLTQVNSSEENNKEQTKKMEEKLKNELEKKNNDKQNISNEEQVKVQALKELIQEKNLEKDETIRFDSPYYERYYCGADVQIWVNNKWFDNIASFQYAITNNKSPVYGYFSENFDAVARGTRLVQGQIGVALTDVQEFNTYIGNISQVDKNAYTKIKDKDGIHEYDKYVGIGFSINIYLGDSLPEHGNITKHRSGTSLKILDCHITNCALYCDTSENPIMMVYNFFARDYSSSLNTLDQIYYNPYDLTVYSNEYGNVNASSYNKNAEKIAKEIGK